jgi:hypothetical protein
MARYCEFDPVQPGVGDDAEMADTSNGSEVEEGIEAK